MDHIRRGQIALAILKHQLREKGINLTSGFREEVEAEAKAIGLTRQEAVEFCELIVRERVDEIFTKVRQVRQRGKGPRVSEEPQEPPATEAVKEKVKAFGPKEFGRRRIGRFPLRPKV